MDNHEQEILKALSSQNAKPSQEFKEQLASSLGIKVKEKPGFQLSFRQYAGGFAALLLLSVGLLSQFDPPTSQVALVPINQGSSAASTSVGEGLEASSRQSTADGPLAAESFAADLDDSSNDFKVNESLYYSEETNSYISVPLGSDVEANDNAKKYEIKVIAPDSDATIYIQNYASSRVAVLPGTVAKSEYGDFVKFENDSVIVFIRNDVDDGATDIKEVRIEGDLIAGEEIARSIISSFSREQR